MAYEYCVDDYKIFSELGGAGQVIVPIPSPPVDAGPAPGPSGGVVQPDMVTPSTAPMDAPAPSTTSLEHFRLNRATGKFEPFSLNNRNGRFEAYRYNSMY